MFLFFFLPFPIYLHPAFLVFVCLIFLAIPQGMQCLPWQRAMLSLARLFATPWAIAHQAPLSMGIHQARILEWVAMLSSKGSPWSRNQTHVSCVGRRILYHWATWEALSFAPLMWKTRLWIKTMLRNLWFYYLTYRPVPPKWTLEKWEVERGVGRPRSKCWFFFFKILLSWEFPGGPAAKTLSSWHMGPGLDPWSGN